MINHKKISKIQEKGLDVKMKSLDKEEILIMMHEIMYDYEEDLIDTTQLSEKLSMLSKKINDLRSSPLTQREVGNFLVCTPLLADMLRHDPTQFKNIVKPLKLLDEFTDRMMKSEDRNDRLMALAIKVKYFDNHAIYSQSKIESAKIFTERIRQNDEQWQIDQQSSYGSKGSATSFYRKYHEFEEELIDLYRDELEKPEIDAIIKVSEAYNHISKAVKKKKSIREKLSDKFTMIRKSL